MQFGASDVFPEALENAAHDEDVIEDGETHEETVEDARHLLAQEDGDGNRVANESEAAQGDLRKQYFNR